MTLAVVIPATEHEPELTQRCYELALVHAQKPTTDVRIWNNGFGDSLGRHTIGDGVNVGSYAVFHRAAAVLEADVILFIHSDLLIYEPGYDRRILAAFEADSQLGLLGFIGSNEIDFAGGRGYGTRSNFQGREPGTSGAESHGARDAGLSAAAVIDGCAMAFRRDVLMGIPYDPDFPIHHFQDRKLSLETLAAGYHVAVLGVACDHLNGRTANSYEGYHALARQWAIDHGCSGVGHGPDHDLYLEGQRLVLSKWRDEKRFFPLVVGADHAIYPTHPLGRLTVGVS